MFAIEIDEVDLAAGLAALNAELDHEVRGAMERSADLVAREAQILAPKVTNDLRDSIHGIAATGTSQAGIEGGVESDSPYGLPVHDGSKPHQIVARNKRALAWPRGAPTHFARSVNHPGNRPNPFMELALELRAPEVEAEFATAFDTAFERAGFGR